MGLMCRKTIKEVTSDIHGDFGVCCYLRLLSREFCCQHACEAENHKHYYMDVWYVGR